MNAPLYTTEILRLAASLPEPRRLDPVGGMSEQRSPTCGSTVRVEVRLDGSGRIEAVSQQVHACAFGQASAALMEAGARGRSREDVARTVAEIEDWLGGVRDDPGGWPAFVALAPARTRRSRHGAILLPFRALLAAMTPPADA